MPASRKATVEEQPSRTRKGRTISPSVEIKAEFNENDELLGRPWALFATAMLRRPDGTYMGSADFSGGSAKPDGLRLGPSRKTCMDFTFSKLQVRVAGTFYFEVTVQEISDAGPADVVSVDTDTFVVYDN